MLADDIPEVEEIIFGTGRGDVTQLVSVTNVGKTTLILNACLSVAAGKPCLPLAPDVPLPRRVLYVDFEATRSKLKQYLVKMRRSFNEAERTLIDENFIPFVDVFVDDEPLCLSNPLHMQLIERRATQYNIALIVIDTISAAFELIDENSNAEVKRSVMKPLRQLAQRTNSAVLFCHHSGKPSESTQAELAYIGRGASTFGSLSRVVFALTKDRKKGDDFVVLHCAKAKRPKFESCLLRLNRDKAWFEACDEKPQLERPLTAQEFAAFVDKKGEVTRKDYLEHFKLRVSEETIDRRKDEALKLGLIERAGRGRVRSKQVSDAVN